MIPIDAKNSGLETETIAYLRTAGGVFTAAQIRTIDNNIKAIKYSTGIILASVAVNTSNVASYYFLSNPSVDLRPYTGFYASLAAGGQTKKVLLGAPGTGETYGEELVDMWLNHPAYPYETLTLGVGPLVTQAIAIAASGHVMYKNVTIANKLLKNTNTVIKASGNLPNVSIASSRDMGSPINFTVNGTSYKTARSTDVTVAIFQVNNNAVDMAITVFSLKQVLTPSATGCWFTLVSDTGVNLNAASFTISITKD
jgi:hypothetical protein